ncbi:phosphoribosyltransferase family protein [Desulfosporosinus sp. Sb-LF]|uniref:phosphoribosyltransferase family protein n=1 Tax=Desulfosporosinus sp. Sb-LF TaxID=2560027 RepID=UPI00107F3839|nr:phosphoribosyltransferase family protein [Desulfosporosinus sp. Sb-LF]TGE34402.1 hypothetical protein E4K68_01560 [Desulfosporosinus sp. Sb-LF]
MNSTISSVFSPKKHIYNLEGQRLTVKITNNPFDFSPHTLFSLAARKNKKRGFLFVSNVLGKHVPVNPFIPMLAGVALAVKFLSEIHGVYHADTQAIVKALKGEEPAKRIYELMVQRSLVVLSEETLFIGFAETATGLGHAAFSLFDNAHYLHTTREQIPLLDSELNFTEDHSHAVNHRCYPLDTKSLESSKMIVLVDDEITTGNTALNIIRAIHGKFPKSDYVVLSLLDWRTTEDRSVFSKLEQQLDTKIHTISLLKGEIAVDGDPIREPIDRVDSTVGTDGFEEAHVFPELKFLDIPDRVKVCSKDSTGYKNVSPYLKLTGRFGLSSKDNLKLVRLAKDIGEELKKDRMGEKTLCLGTGEFMYFPMLVAAHMGEGIRYHSTTRSPIYPFAKPQYAIQNGFAYISPDEASITNYLYNVPLQYYDEVYLFMEREVSHERLVPMLTIFRELGIPRLVLVMGTSGKEVPLDD